MRLKCFLFDSQYMFKYLICKALIVNEKVWILQLRKRKRDESGYQKHKDEIQSQRSSKSRFSLSVFIYVNQLLATLT